MAWYHRISALFRRERLTGDIDRELSFHMDERVDELTASGMDIAEARRMARRQFGNPVVQRERTLDVDLAVCLESLAKDVRHALRSMRLNKAFTTTAVLCLGLGIGANTAIFTLLNTLLLNPLPIDDSSGLAAVLAVDTRRRASGGDLLEISYRNLQYVRAGNEVFTDLAGYTSTGGLSMWRRGSSETVRAELVTGNYFDVLGIRPFQGRWFLPEEDRTPGGGAVVVLGYGVWQQRFGADPSIIGTEIRLRNTMFTVVGVAPEGFKGVNSFLGPDLWIPTSMARQMLTGQNRNVLDDRSLAAFRGVGRLKAGVTLEKADANARVIADALAQSFPEANTDRGIAVRPLSDVTLFGMRDYITAAGSVLMGIVGLVLLIACSNVANLLLARASARRHEIAVRQALGAGRARLMAQLLTESVAVSLLGGLVGLVIAVLVRDLLWSMRPAEVANNFVMPKMDATVFLFAAAISVAAGLIFGIVPALQLSRGNAVGALKEDSRTAGRSRRRIRTGQVLVVGQVALSLICLVTAGLFLRSIQQAYAINPGFDTEHLAFMTVNPGDAGFTPSRSNQFLRDARSRVANLPGISSASLATNMPLWGRASRPIIIEGAEQRDRSSGTITLVNTIDVDYFRTMDIDILSGRDLTENDNEESVPLAIINEAMAERHWPNQNAIGRRFRFVGETEFRQVAGIVRTVKIVTLSEAPQPCIYLPVRQNPVSAMMLYVRTPGDPAAVVETVRREIAQMNSNVPVSAGLTGRQLIENSLWMVRLGVGLLGAFGLLALVLASVGLYGVTAYSVSRRRREIGIRMALGSDRAAVVGLVLRQGMTMVVLGAAFGIAGALVLARAFASLLVGVSPMDPISLGASAGTLLLVAALACYLPASRASRMDPVGALREA
jgi:predicted permease